MVGSRKGSVEGGDGREGGAPGDDKELFGNSKEGEAVNTKECEGVNSEEGGNDDLLLLSAQSRTPKVSVITSFY